MLDVQVTFLFIYDLSLSQLISVYLHLMHERASIQLSLSPNAGGCTGDRRSRRLNSMLSKYSQTPLNPYLQKPFFQA
jgi:hypothetical protein